MKIIAEIAHMKAFEEFFFAFSVALLENLLITNAVLCNFTSRHIKISLSWNASIEF